MKHRQLMKVGLAALLIPVILLTGLVGMVISSLHGGDRFYTPLVAAAAVVVIAFLIVLLFTRIQPRKTWLGLTGFILLFGVAIGVYEINRAYHNSFARVDQGVDLYAYQPFQEGSKAVHLEDSATLRLEGDLPRLDGATALYPLYAAFAQAVYPEGEYEVYGSEVQSSNTVYAYASLIKGETDIVFAAHPSQEQMDEAKAAGKELKLTPIGREAFVFFVQADNPIQGLTLQDIRDIYAGRVTNWWEVGGKNSPIRAFQRPEGSGSQTALQRLMEGETLMTPPKEDVAAGMGGIIEQTADYRNYPNALGYSFRYFATEMVNNGEIRLLSIDGVYPNRETIASGEYPLTSEFYAVTTDTEHPQVEPFIAWILSDQGQEIIQRTGYNPLNR
ncbi:PstS family phosphate ABC transporter substrate-binding protein [Paenibacillus daejeonensis]|uniref:PstS family phosphate ABC transporter substrate-binding protein n=1 Tax=Paenibacillus daejeonensis TaxID=135193 RepID=UPI00037C3DE2|nr:PstS family phosphate ABC transporter substrate-binding protein [Paenibacillus daejeonensis]